MTDHFDEFSKSLADNSIPRRESLRWLGGVVAGVLGTWALGVGNVESHDGANRDRQRRRRRRYYQKDACRDFCNRCSNTTNRAQCLDACRACDNSPKRLKGSCGSYVCCAAGLSYCRGACVDFKTDPGNCGSCGRTCPAGQECVSGRCRAVACPPGQTKCGSSCVDLAYDSSNCGACGNVCGASTPYCFGGTCMDCFPGQSKCNGTCVDLMYDTSNCGACGNVCGASTPYCFMGVCKECDYTEMKCNGVCIDIYYDSNNCGGCGIVCGPDVWCEGGSCTGHW